MADKSLKQYSVLLFMYVFLIIVMALCEMGKYSIEAASVGFLIAGLVFLFLKIDARFLVMCALLCLGYCPFLIAAGLSAENIAIYAYYFLVVSVLVQIGEFVKKYKVALDFEEVMKKVLLKDMFWEANKLLLAVTVVLWIVNYKNPFVAMIWKYQALYLLVVVSLFNGLSKWLKKDQKLLG
ncbi:MAG: hypothetical protein ABIG95_03335 [Candidatus Woesearchaeota archaeon]